MKKPLVFITGEEKNDWVRKAGNIVIGPRFELIDEYRRASEGQSFYIANLSRLLELHAAPVGTVREVQNAERISAGEKLDADSSNQESMATDSPYQSGSGYYSDSGSGYYMGSGSGPIEPPDGSSGSSYDHPNKNADELPRLFVYWEDGMRDELAYKDGSFIGPSTRTSKAGEVVPATLISINGLGVTVDGITFPPESWKPFLANFTHKGCKI